MNEEQQREAFVDYMPTISIYKLTSCLHNSNNSQIDHFKKTIGDFSNVVIYVSDGCFVSIGDIAHTRAQTKYRINKLGKTEHLGLNLERHLSFLESFPTKKESFLCLKKDDYVDYYKILK